MLVSVPLYWALPLPPPPHLIVNIQYNCDEGSCCTTSSCYSRQSITLWVLLTTTHLIMLPINPSWAFYPTNSYSTITGNIQTAQERDISAQHTIGHDVFNISSPLWYNFVQINSIATKPPHRSRIGVKTANMLENCFSGTYRQRIKIQL